MKGNEITAIRFKCDGCEGEFLECDVATTGGSEVYCEECFKEKQKEAKVLWISEKGGEL